MRPPLGLARSARRIAVTAAYGGGGLGVVGAAAATVLVTEAKLARRWIGRPTGHAPRADGRYGGRHRGVPVRLAVLGDSSAAGLGVEDPLQTPGALLATGLAEALHRPVDLTCVARTGARSDALEAQVALALEAAPDVAVIMVGANDVTHRVRAAVSVGLLDDAVRALQDAGARVVVGTCPDLGTVEPVAQPLRYLARRWSRQLAAAQTIVTVEAGARTVSLGDLLGPEFTGNPREMFGPDRFHPSAAGYRALATALLPSVAAALGAELDPLETDPRTLPSGARGELGVRTVALAAATAATQAGTEVTPASVAGRERGPRGRWALLRRRRPHQLPEVEAPAGGGGGTPAPAPGAVGAVAPAPSG